jgi:predicted GIY-YIG superfamily endonuclease
MSKQPAVYILANRERGTLYVGVTGNLKLRILGTSRGAGRRVHQQVRRQALGLVRTIPGFSRGDSSREADQKVESGMEARVD